MRQVRWFLLVSCMLSTTALVACGDDDDEDEEGSSNGGGNGGGDNGGGDNGGGTAGGAGYCSQSGATAMCDGTTNCAFDPATVDCTAACNNIQALCDSGCAGEDAACEGFDVSACVPGCEGTKALACTNLTFGCYAMSSDCDTVGNSVADGR